jgi:hypothetical protein
MMQTFYIDADDEVNSVIGKIRKSNAQYNILAIAQGSLLMQSPVSLKLIKRESDNLKKEIMIITKDERAASIAKKIGFSVRANLDELKVGENNVQDKKVDFKNELNLNKTGYLNQERILTKKNRLTSLGVDNFMPAPDLAKGDELSMGILSISQNNGQREETEKNISENYFDLSKKDEENKKNFSVGGVVKFLWIFIFVILLLATGVAGYFFLPNAEIKVFPLKKEESMKLNLLVSNDLENMDSLQNDAVKLKIETTTEDDVLALTFPATSQKGDPNQKAKGVITIYNEFSETSQILVATTRFLSNNDKLFRLVNTVTVPGMKMVGDKIEAGKVEAEVVADESGVDFNIKEADFKIPGFKGSSKYDKFYAKLIQETKGGDSSQGELKIVSKEDIAKAKNDTENQLKNILKDKIKNKAGNENVLFDKFLSYEILDYSVFPEDGAVTENFEYQVKMRVKALSFSAKEIDEKIKNFINSRMLAKSVPMELVAFDISYENTETDFSKEIIKAELNISAKLKSKIDGDKVAISLAGKNKGELNKIVSAFPEISKIEAIISPNFISNNFPKYLSRIKIIIAD